MINNGRERLLAELHSFFKKVLSLKAIPFEWKEPVLIPIFKKGEKSDPQTYRGTNPISAVQKLFTKILAGTLTGVCEEQCGFGSNKSTTNAVFIFRQITDRV